METGNKDKEVHSLSNSRAVKGFLCSNWSLILCWWREVWCRHFLFSAAPLYASTDARKFAPKWACLKVSSKGTIWWAADILERFFSWKKDGPSEFPHRAQRGYHHRPCHTARRPGTTRLLSVRGTCGTVSTRGDYRLVCLEEQHSWFKDHSECTCKLWPKSIPISHSKQPFPHPNKKAFEYTAALHNETL